MPEETVFTERSGCPFLDIKDISCQLPALLLIYNNHRVRWQQGNFRENSYCWFFTEVPLLPTIWYIQATGLLSISTKTTLLYSFPLISSTSQLRGCDVSPRRNKMSLHACIAMRLNSRRSHMSPLQAWNLFWFKFHNNLSLHCKPHISTTDGVAEENVRRSPKSSGHISSGNWYWK